jgi:hypothetical protein
MLQIFIAIFITYILIKLVQIFDSLASDIEVTPLVFIMAIVAIILIVLLPEHLMVLQLPSMFLVALLRLRSSDLLSWGRAIIYSFVVLFSFVLSNVLLQLLLKW